MTIAEIILLGPGEGAKISVRGDKYTFKAATQDTGGAYALLEIETVAGAGGPPAHMHAHEKGCLSIISIGCAALLDSVGTTVL